MTMLVSDSSVLDTKTEGQQMSTRTKQAYRERVRDRDDGGGGGGGGGEGREMSAHAKQRHTERG